MNDPLCKDCKHVVKGWFTPARYWQCSSPRNGINPVSGEPVIRFAGISRQGYGVWCAQDGRYFEAKQ